MSDVTVGPIQTYTNDSTLLPATTTQTSIQERVSVTLTDSNLWLVDTSKLSGQTTNSQTQYTILNLQTANQLTTSFDNVNFTAATIAPTGLASSESFYLQSNLPDGNSLMLASVTGGTQLSSGGMTLLATGSSGIISGGADSSGTAGGLSGTGGGTGSSGSGASSSSSDNQSTSSTQSTSTPNPQPTVSPQPPVPVPFEVSPTFGLLLLTLLFSCKLIFRRIRFELSSWV